MKNSFKDLIEQTFEFPTNEFSLKEGQLLFNGIDLLDIVGQYEAPLKITYLPKITEKIERARMLFSKAMKVNNYKGGYEYCYCTKSNHFSFVIEKVLQSNANLEISYGFDIEIIKALEAKGKLNKDIKIICNGYKTDYYKSEILKMHQNGFKNIMPVIDNQDEIDYFDQNVKEPIHIGLRIATEEEPGFEFYTSRLGINSKIILENYKNFFSDHPMLHLKMIHFFVDTGIQDNAYYWNEFLKAIDLYIELKKIAPHLTDLNIGGGFPFVDSLAFDYDFDYMVNQIVYQIKQKCEEAGVDEPNIYTEFGKYSVAESGASIFKVLGQKKQNDRENWYMINGSLMTSIPDIWGIDQKYITLPLNRWEKDYSIVNIGGLSCDNEDYYNSEIHKKQLFLPNLPEEDDLYIGFFHTGAYQDALAGYGGVKHCLIPSPKHVVIDQDENGELTHFQYRGEQLHDPMLEILGYK